MIRSAQGLQTNHDSILFYLVLFSGVVLLGAAVTLNPLAGSILGICLLILVLSMIKPIVGMSIFIVLMPHLNIGFLLKNPVRINNEFFPLALVPLIIVFLSSLLAKAASPKNLDKPANEIDETIFQTLFVVIILLICISLFWTPDLVHGIYRLMMMLFCIYTYKITASVFSNPVYVRAFFLLLPLLQVILAAQLLLSEVYPDFYEEFKLFGDFSFVTMLHHVELNDKLRVGGFAPVDVAGDIINFFIFCNIAAIAVFIKKNWVRLLVFLETMLLLYCMLKTASKANAGTLILGLCVLPIIVPEFRNKAVRIFAALFALFSIVFVVMGRALIKRISAMLSGKTGFLSDRLDWWEKGFSLFDGTQGIGLGAGGFAFYIDPVPAAHSIYFSLIFELGVAGFILFILLWGGMLVKFTLKIPAIRDFTYRMTLYCLLTVIVMSLIHGLVDLDYTYLTLWFFLGLTRGIIDAGIRDTGTNSNRVIPGLAGKKMPSKG